MQSIDANRARRRENACQTKPHSIMQRMERTDFCVKVGQFRAHRHGLDDNSRKSCWLLPRSYEKCMVVQSHIAHQYVETAVKATSPSSYSYPKRPSPHQRSVPPALWRPPIATKFWPSLDRDIDRNREAALSP